MCLETYEETLALNHIKSRGKQIDEEISDAEQDNREYHRPNQIQYGASF